VITSVVLRSGLGGLVGFTLALLFGLEGTAAGVAALGAAAPVGFTAVVLSAREGLDLELTASAAAISVFLGSLWIPLAVTFSLVFLPVPFHDTALIVYALVTQLLFRTVYAAVNIPYGAMMASMTRDSMERNWLAGARMLFAFSGSAVVGYATPRLVAWLGVSNPDSAYFWSAAILSSLATLVIFASYGLTEERLEPVAEQQAHPPLS
jgi:predicted permease